MTSERETVQGGLPMDGWRGTEVFELFPLSPYVATTQQQLVGRSKPGPSSLLLSV